MGAIWSKPGVEAVRGTEASAVSARKRRVDGETNGTVAKRARVATVKEDEVLDVRRFCVRCSNLFWASKKDVQRVLGKVRGLPTVVRVHKIARWGYFFVTFRTCDAEEARRILGAVEHRGEQFEVADAQMVSARRRRSDAAVAAAGASDRDGAMRCSDAATATAPWGMVAYDEQSARKLRGWRAALSRVGGKMKADARVRAGLGWLREQRSGAAVCAFLRGEFCEDEGLRDYYRNKTEFTVGMSRMVDGQKGKPTVGYALGLSRDGNFCVGQVTEKCRTTSVIAREIADVVQKVVVQSGQPVYDRLEHVGYWRLVTVRSSLRTAEAVVVVMVSLAGVDEDAVNDAGCRELVAAGLRDLFQERGKFGLFWQTSDALAPALGSVHAEHVCGLTGGVRERLLGLHLRIHPNAFFQVHTAMAERLYGVVAECARVTKKVTVLDVCCGTGTIALTLASKAHSVVGVEISEAAVEDAKWNAKLNQIDNAKFIAGAAEKVIVSAMQLLAEDKECVAVLDPPRAGVANQVICAVRAATKVVRVVYVSCEPANAWRNIMALCRPTSKQFRGTPFRPISAIGVDMFPHTPHGELVFLLERCN